MSIAAVDPYGSRVTIPESLVPAGKMRGSSMEATDSPAKVIQHPALMLTSCVSDPSSCTTQPCETHYLRLINSRDTLLISARKIDGNWIAYNCMYNPSPQQLAPILRNNRQLV